MKNLGIILSAVLLGSLAFLAVSCSSSAKKTEALQAETTPSAVTPATEIAATPADLGAPSAGRSR